MKKVSFLIAAHNEEKYIGKVLDNLTNLDYKDYEIILGLDGCTDNTEKIVKRFSNKNKKISWINLNIRSGKPAVINNIINLATGEIIIINDSDWILKVKGHRFKEILEIFNDEKIAGIAESFPVELDEKNLKESNLGYKVITYGTFYWMEYQKRKYCSLRGNLYFIEKPHLFMTNIFRKSFYKPNFLLGDDFERTKDIMDSGGKIVLFKNQDMPRMTAIYNQIRIRDILKQKIRTSIAREQFENKIKINIGLGYYVSSTYFCLGESLKKSFKVFSYVIIWVLINIFGILISKFIKLGTREGWKLRVRR